MLGLWHALTATGRLLVLGATEAWGFWILSIPLLLVIFFAATMLNGIAWRMIEGRLKPKLRDRDAEARLNGTIRDLKAQLFDLQLERAQLASKVAQQSRVIEAGRNFNRNWNADAGRVAGKAAAQ